jgi:hypothetical protein
MERINRDEFIKSMARAIARFEGFFKNGSIAQTHNNPGNLRRWGRVKVSPKGYAQFPSEDAGWRALFSQIGLNINRGLTFYEFFAGQRDGDGKVSPGGYYGYAPSQDSNHPGQYAGYVVGHLNAAFGCEWTVATRLKDVVD